MEGNNSNVEIVPLRMRHLYNGQMDNDLDNVASHSSAAPPGSGDCGTEPASPPSTKTQSPPEVVIMGNLLYLRIISHILTGGVNTASLLRSSWVASSSHPLRRMVEQLKALYDLRHRLDGEVSLIKIINEDRDLNEAEFLTKHFGSPCKIHPHRFPRKVFVRLLLNVSKRVNRTLKLDFLEKKLSPEETLQLDSILKMETEACLKQSGWTQDMAEMEEAVGEGHEYFSRLLKVLPHLSPSSGVV